MSETNDTAVKTAQLEAKIRDLENIARIVANTLNLVADMDIKGSHVEPVLEIVNYNRGFKQQIDGQIATLKSMLPTVEAPKEATLSEAK